MRAFLNAYYRLLRFLLILLMAVLIVPVVMQITSRFVDFVPRYIWTEEIARFCFVWIVLIGAMIAVREGTHFDVDVLPHSRNPLLELISRLFVHACILLMALSFLYWGYDFALLGMRQVSEISGLPMLSIYIAWPVAGATWCLFSAEKIWDDVNAYRRRDL